MDGTCRLCQQLKQLRKSHILPEFMYQNLYDSAPKRFYTVYVDPGQSEKDSIKIEQKGIREYLLCQDCEGLISKYERYAAETIYAKNKGNKVYIVHQSHTPDGKYYLYDYAGFSYKDFKLFLMSMFWRVLIANNYTDIKADVAITDRLREAILTENPLEFDDFGCLLQVIRYNENTLASKFILMPYLTDDGGN